MEYFSKHQFYNIVLKTKQTKFHRFAINLVGGQLSQSLEITYCVIFALTTYD